MTFDPKNLLNKNFPVVQQPYTSKNSMLYVLGVAWESTL
jgi:hypothetical protein